MSLPSHIPDEIYFPAPPSLSPCDPEPYHIIFLPGNPGCIAYYRVFLATLHSLLNNPSSSSRAAIYARSLRGFELHPQHSSTSKSQLTSRFKMGPWGLQSQIEFAEAIVQSYVSKLARPSSSSSPQSHHSTKAGEGKQQKPKIILIAHSLGTFLTLELLRRRNARLLQAQQRREWCHDSTFDISAAILLFPTITDIAASPSGRTIGRVAQLPYAAAVISFFASILLKIVGIFGTAAVRGVVKAVTGMPEDAAAVTVTWLRRKGSVYQALYLAKEEMEGITEDRWDDEIWSTATSTRAMENGDRKLERNEGRTKLFFYYAQKDHWIANHTRDALIAARGRRKKPVIIQSDEQTEVGGGDDDDDEKPVMEIDEGDVPHGFCIRHSVPVAEKTAEYIRQVMQAT